MEAPFWLIGETIEVAGCYLAGTYVVEDAVDSRDGEREITDYKLVRLADSNDPWYFYTPAD